ncbi:MAG: DMT family transporter [Ruminococcus sp.]|nr:DMT family transporter [Ruminococcus sp.]
MNRLLQKKSVACLGAVFCTLLWGTAFPFIKLGYQAFGIAEGDVGSMLLFAGLRFFIAGAMVLCAYSVFQKRFVKLQRSEWKAVFWLGSVQTAGQYLFTYGGIGFTTGTNTSIITACAAFLTVLAAPLVFKSDRLTILKMLGCALGFGGVLLINGGGGFSPETLFGDIVIFISTVFAAGGNLIAKKTTQTVDPIKITAYQLMFGGLFLTVTGAIWGGSLDLLRWQGALILLWLALVSAAAFSVWTTLLKYHAAGRIAVFNLLVPVFGTALSGLLLGENIFQPATALSLLLIACGIVLVNVELKGVRK